MYEHYQKPASKEVNNGMTKNEVLSYWYNNQKLNHAIDCFFRMDRPYFYNGRFKNDFKQEIFLHFLEKESEEKILNLHYEGKFKAAFMHTLRHATILTYTGYYTRKNGELMTYVQIGKYYKKYAEHFFSLVRTQEKYDILFNQIVFDGSGLENENKRVGLIVEIVEQISKLNWWDKECLLQYTKHENITKVARLLGTHVNNVMDSLASSRKKIQEVLLKKELIDKTIKRYAKRGYIPEIHGKRFEKLPEINFGKLLEKTKGQIQPTWSLTEQIFHYLQLSCKPVQAADIALQMQSSANSNFISGILCKYSKTGFIKKRKVGKKNFYWIEKSASGD